MVTVIRDLELVKNIKFLTQNSVVLYGAGAKGVEIYNFFRKCAINVTYFCDSDKNKWQNSLCGVSIISPSQLKDKLTENKMISIVITCVQYQSVLDSLNLYGIFCKNTFTGNGAMFAIALNCDQHYMDFYSSVQKNVELTFLKEHCKMIAIQYLKSYITSTEKSIWVYQPGKVGSTTLAFSLGKKGKQIIHFHSLKYPEQILEGSLQKEWIQAVDYIKKRSVKIISVVREPLARDYSTFWQAFSTPYERIRILPIVQPNLQNMYNKFMGFMATNEQNGYYKFGVGTPWTWREEFNWFDKEIKDVLGIDIFKYPFDKEKGYSIIKKDNIEILLLKTEKLVDNLDIIRNYVNIQDLTFANANMASQKEYYTLYKQFRKEVRLTKDYVAHYYDKNEKFNHFYTEAEKEYFLESWKNNIVD